MLMKLKRRKQFGAASAKQDKSLFLHMGCRFYSSLPLYTSTALKA